ncbi:hypothetical protein [Streptomyces sp. Isolate_219]|uniref:hypothetical protein n=1 Tax=Streptomyces sp. Isolate_219 TaxID=2950110 RepID=UPI0021C91B1C|nr:hypothetical protein [Streptomyces sp. Isolate_219]MCR8574148.1 hypothetical protein [Streptomyces sp. Isolate_219]
MPARGQAAPGPRTAREPGRPALAVGSEGPDSAPTPPWALVALGVVACAVLAAACWTASHVHADPPLQAAARFLHLAALIVGLGAVLTVDWLALLWLLGRRRLSDVLQTAGALHTPIWLGLGGLVLSGLFLHPDLSSPLTLIKLGFVLAVMLNGLYAHWVGQRLSQLQGQPGSAPGIVPRRLMKQTGIAASISQVGWWGASVIGFLNSHP